MLDSDNIYLYTYNMKLRVSHESPISILQYSKEYNDFDYCLVHLCEKYPEYLDFFVLGRSVYSRDVLLDNSLFELGKAFDPARYMHFARLIKPSYIIAPDEMEGCENTIKGFKSFDETYGKELGDMNIAKIGATQGKTYQELVECYKFMSDNADIIAISFDWSYYQLTGIGKTKLERSMNGRINLIRDLIEDGVWNWNKPVHLLGCSLAREFSWYVNNNIYNITSCDTSNPVVAAIHNLKYNGVLGLNTKPSTMLADLITHKFNEDQMDALRYNVNAFKQIIGR